MLNSRFDWSLVPSFLAALEHGSLLGAARALRASQPTLGRHIAELETQLDVVLFERTGRGLQPTDSALQLADAARAMQSGADRLAAGVARAATQLGGTVRISASQPVACGLLPPLLARMRVALPEIQIELVASNAVSNLLRREADIALRMVRPVQASLIARRVAQVGFGAYAQRAYLRRHGTPQRLAELLDHALIGGDRDDTVLRGFRAAGVPAEAQHFALRCDDLVACWEAVRAGLGIGFVAEYLARGERGVQRVLPDLKIPPLPIWLTVHREIRSSPRIRAAYDFLATELAAALAT